MARCKRCGDFVLGRGKGGAGVCKGCSLVLEREISQRLGRIRAAIHATRGATGVAAVRGHLEEAMGEVRVLLRYEGLGCYRAHPSASSLAEVIRRRQKSLDDGGGPAPGVRPGLPAGGPDPSLDEGFLFSLYRRGEAPVDDVSPCAARFSGDDETPGERRSSERKAVRFRADVHPGGSTVTVEDISLGGAFLQCLPPAKAAPRVRLTLRGSAGPIPVDGAVCWVRWRPTSRAGLGVRFLGVSAELDRFVASCGTLLLSGQA